MIITRIIQDDKPLNVRQVITLLQSETKGGLFDEFLSKMTIEALIELHIQNEEYRYLFKYMKDVPEPTFPQIVKAPYCPAGANDRQ